MKIRAFAILLGLASLAFGQNQLTEQERKDGFQLIFDGKTLDHWHTIKRRPNDSAWTMENGILSYTKGESWLATNDTYYDFILRLEYKTAEKCDSGVFVNASPNGAPGTTGIELNIISDSGAPATARSTSSLWDIVAPSKNTNRPDGEWNTVEISVVNRKLTAVWNGEKVQEVNLDDPQYPKLATKMGYGHIGLQAHASGEPASFRNLRLKVLKIGPPIPVDK